MLYKKTLTGSGCSIVIFTILLLINGCGSGVEREIEAVQVDFTFKRFEQDLFHTGPDITQGELESINKNYPVFAPLFIHNILEIPDGNDSAIAANLSLFCSDTEVAEVYSLTDSIYQDLSWLKAEMEGFLKHYRYYFPEKPVPDIVTFISAFNYAVIASDSTIGIGLDMFLGQDADYYPRMGIPKYLYTKFSSNYITASVLKGWFQSDYDVAEVKKELLSQMVYQGKMLYYLEKMSPGMNDTLITGYTGSQLLWCRDNEPIIWSFFIENKLLFNTDPSEYLKFINDGPTTNGFPDESPGRIGAWVGWQIVKKYMSSNSGITLEQLLNNQDALKILESSGYKPQR